MGRHVRSVNLTNKGQLKDLKLANNNHMQYAYHMQSIKYIYLSIYIYIKTPKDLILNP